MSDKKKCAHATCSCAALLLMDYCCEECRFFDEQERAGEQPMKKCSCGHADCTAEPEVSAEVQGLMIASEALAQP